MQTQFETHKGNLKKQKNKIKTVYFNHKSFTNKRVLKIKKVDKQKVKKSKIMIGNSNV